MLLGPQRRPTVDRVVRSLDIEGPIATVTAGWQEREGDDIELDEQLGGRSVNLRLYERWGDIQERDHEFVAATRRRRDELLELRHTYVIRLGHALAAVHDLAPDAEEVATVGSNRDAGSGALSYPAAVSSGAVGIDRGGGDAVRVEVSVDDVADSPGESGGGGRVVGGGTHSFTDSSGHPTLQRRRSAARAEARARAIEDVRRIDAEHVARLDEHNAEFIARWAPHERDIVARHRVEVARGLDESGALTIAGGHVAVLVGLLHLFALDPPRRLPIIAWSAGAMALTEQVVIYHDRTVQGPSDAEIYGRGIGVVLGTVAVPHARDRLLLNDTDRMAVLSARFAPATCVLLHPGTRLDVGFDGALPAAAQVLGSDGHVQVLAEATA